MRNIDKYETELREMLTKDCNLGFSKTKRTFMDCHYFLCNDCAFKGRGGNCMNNAIEWLMEEYKELPILDKEEKQYLENVLKPFKNRVLSIIKRRDQKLKKDCILIHVKSLCGEEKVERMFLPYFELNAMYKNMEPEKSYTLKELGLFEGGN